MLQAEDLMQFRQWRCSTPWTLRHSETPGDQNKFNLFSFSWRRKRKKKILEEESKMRGLAC
jgi:hypothetical protein